MFKTVCLFAVLLATHTFASQPLIIGIAGGTGSGKTTLAENLIELFPGQAVLIYQDAYYKDLSNLPFEARTRTNFDHPNSLDFDLLKQHLTALKNNEPISMPQYSFHSHAREPRSKTIQPTALIIVEGILLFAVPELRDLFDIKIFVDTDDDVRLLRRIERDMKERSRDFVSIRDQYLKTVKPMHDTFVEPSKRYADVIIPTDRRNAKGLSMIVSKLKEELQSSRID
jgi:uridine kinase